MRGCFAASNGQQGEKGIGMDWFMKFPTMDANGLRNLKKAIDEGFRAFTRAYGDSIESIFEPLQHFLIWSERFMTRTRGRSFCC